MNARRRYQATAGFRCDLKDRKPVLTPKQLEDQAHTERIKEAREAEASFSLPSNLNK
ncbi:MULTISPECIES: hypothetical protein [unclassified Caballeronia]|uniref:hypothetical protein n=1 Tax=unclassified Caballeronia TaxID=2646786 RepID=UPI002027B47C|nr:MULTISPECIES: hypothetical protein [unclassified Caballeronia]